MPKSSLARFSSLFALLCIYGCGPQQAQEPPSAPSQTQEAVDPSYQDLFNGSDLTGWAGDDPFWRVEDGVIIGEITATTVIDANRFLVYQGKMPDDFELIVEFQVTADGNSGINYRSDPIEGLSYQALTGYQYDIDGKVRYVGSNYEEKRRSTLASIGETVTIPMVSAADSLKHRIKNQWAQRDIQIHQNADTLKANFKHDDWNTARIVAQGKVLSHYLNGVLMSQVVDNDTIRGRSSGKLGVQVHIGPPMKIMYRSMKVREL
ncbi:MAG: DUF1080 domain-containing protein [Bacteroidota bacterium]